MSLQVNQTLPTLAFVTLLTSDSYLPGVLTTLKSLLDVESITTDHKPFETVCLVTPSTVGQNSIKALEKSFDKVIGVEVINTNSWSELNLLGRNDLASTLTKLHLFRLTQYTKVIYLDADTLILRSISHLFNLPAPFSASPDVGWPDCFNSGVMVLTPSQKTFDGLVKMMGEEGSWDGGDQGLLNTYFKDWNRLSFTYNVTPSAYYTYTPAYRRHGESTSVLHFIGETKPWTRGNRSNSSTTQEALSNDYYNLIGKWYDVFERHFGMGITFDVAKRVSNPPESFKSSFIQLPNSSSLPSSSTLANRLPIPIPISVSTLESNNATAVWDPSKSSPPRNSSVLQMKEAITTKYDNIWDDPSKSKQRTRFTAPDKYAPAPKETHEWYQSVMKFAPDPKAIKPVFPWEEQLDTSSSSTSTSTLTSTLNSSTSKSYSDLPPSARIASRIFPADELPRPLPNINTSSSSNPSLMKPNIVSPTFTNAWDSIPAIGRYAKNLAKVSAAKEVAAKGEGKSGSSSGKKISSGGSGVSGGEREGGGVWRSSLKEMRIYPRRGDASSRDGDDEDDLEEETVTENENGETEEEEEDEVEKDRIKIKFKVRQDTSTSTSNSTSGSVENQGNSRPSRSRSTSAENLAQLNATSMTSSSSNKPRKDTRPTPPSPRPFPSELTDSPRHLATTAIRNSAAAAARASGQGTPILLTRATRVFSPDTDTGAIKREGLAALKRFMSMENGGVGGLGGGGGGEGGGGERGVGGEGRGTGGSSFF